MRSEEIKTLARSLMDQHSLKDWSVFISPSQKYRGRCHIDSKKIELSIYLQEDSEWGVKNTILHEISHALDSTRRTLNPLRFHDAAWSELAKSIGCDGKKCGLSLNVEKLQDGLTAAEVGESKLSSKFLTTGKVKAVCPTCGKVAKEKSEVFIKSTGIYIIKLECGHFIKRTESSKTSTEDIYTAIKSQHDADGVSRSLFPFQIEGVQFGEHAGGRFLCADEMGLGKTVQALAFLRLHPEDTLPVLIVVKKKTITQWAAEVFRWTGLIAQPLLKSKDKPNSLFKVHLVSYDLLRRMDGISSYPYKTVVLDECQSIKNPESIRTSEVRDICRERAHIIGLSGTPIKNNAGEYFTILNILRPEKFPSYKKYVDWYCNVDYSNPSYPKVGGLRDPEEFARRTKDFIIRRERKEVLKDLPSINRTFFHVDMMDNEKLAKEYERATEAFERSYFGKYKSEPKLDNILAAINAMRHIVGLAKVVPTVEYVTDFLLSSNRKIVIFAHHDDVLLSLEHLLNQWMEAGGYDKVANLKTASDTREAILTFTSNPNQRVLIASGLAAGEGIDGLQKAVTDVIIMERQWNPANEQQMEDRICRIGQMSEAEMKAAGIQLNAIYPIASQTIDEVFTEIVERKRVWMAEAGKGERIVAWEQDSLLKELASVLASKGARKFKI